MSAWLIVLIVLLAVSLVNTVLLFLVDFLDVDEYLVLRIMGGIFTWILVFTSFIIHKIKTKKRKKENKQ